MRLFGLEIRRARREGDRVNEQQLMPGAFADFVLDAAGATNWSWQQMVAAYTSWVYIAIDKIAKTVAMLPLDLYVYRKAKSGKVLQGAAVKRELKSLSDGAAQRRWLKAHSIERERVHEHPFLDLMTRPNHLIPRYGLWYDTMVKLELAGSVGWYMPPNRLGQPGEIWVLPLTETAVLRPLPDSMQVIKGYEYRDGALTQRFSVDELLWMRYPSPKSPLVGQSPLVAQTYPYNVDAYLDQYQYYALANRAHVGMNLTTDHELTKEQIETIREQIRADYEGAKKAGKLFVTHSGFKIGAPLTTDLRALLVNEAANGVRDKLLAAYDVPAGAVGIIDDVNRATMEVIQETFITQCVKPRLMMIEEYIEAFILPRYDDRLTCDFELPQFSERALDLQERRENLSSGYTTINEERERAGLAPVPWGDAPWLPYGLAQPYTDKPPTTEEYAPPQKGRYTKAHIVTTEYWDEKRRTHYWEDYAQAHQHWEAHLTGTARKLFRAQLATLLDKLRDYEPKFLARTAGWSRAKRAEWVKARDATAAYNLNKGEERTRTQKLFAPVLKDLVEFFGKRRGENLLGSAKAVAAGVVFDAADPRVQKWLGTRLEFFSKEITDCTFDDVKAILREAFEEGVSSAVIAQHLRDKFASWDKYRAPLIARTETTAGSNFADLEAVHQAGLEGRVLKIWISARDEATRATHLAAETAYADGIPIDAEFTVGGDSMQAPGGGTDPAENINCRCVLGYVEVAQ